MELFGIKPERNNGGVVVVVVTHIYPAVTGQRQTQTVK